MRKCEVHKNAAEQTPNFLSSNKMSANILGPERKGIMTDVENEVFLQSSFGLQGPVLRRPDSFSNS